MSKTVHRQMYSLPPTLRFVLYKENHVCLLSTLLCVSVRFEICQGL